jgi:acyl-homoserine lactone acylase PvdQ
MVPRGEADSHGYYARSTDEEIIKYLNSYLMGFNDYKKRIRKEKLKQIKEK